MARAIWTKLRNDPNGNWSRHEGEPPFSIPVVGGMYYDVYTDAGDSFVIMPQIAAEAPKLSGAPVVEGTFEIGQTLTAIAAPATGTPPIATAWQWLRDGVEIIGATDVTYTLKNADEGKAIAVRQSDSNAHGTDSATSEAVTVAPVIPVVTAPVISGLPTIAGIAEVGQTLTATAAPSTGTAPIETTWQWLRDGTEIPGADSENYTLIEANEGADVSVRQTDTNAGGNGTAVSAARAVAAISVPPAITNYAVTATGDGEVTLDFDTTQGEGNFYWVATNFSQRPSRSQIELGKNHLEKNGVQSGSIQLSTFGAQQIVITGLTNGIEVWIHGLQRNNAGQDSGTEVDSAIPVKSAETINPEISGDLFTASGGGSPAHFNVTGNYTGDDALVMEAVFLGKERPSVPVTAAELIAQASSTATDTLEYFRIDPFSYDAGDFDIPLLSPASESAVRIVYQVREKHNGGTTSVQAPNDAIVGLDFTPPAAPTAVSDKAGDTIVLTYAETIYGSENLDNITVNGVAAGAPTIDSIMGFGSETIVIQLSGNLIQPGETITVDYSGGDWRDENGYPADDLVKLTVRNNATAGFTENGVTITANDHLVASAAIPADTYKSILYFFSVVGNKENSSREVLLSMLERSSSLYASYAKGDGGFGMQTNIESSANSLTAPSNETIPEGTRYHGLWSAWVDGTNLRSVGYLYNTVTSQWIEAHDQSVVNGSGFLNLGVNPLKLFLREDADAHQFLGTTFRQALWAATTGAAIGDITDPTVRDAFINGPSIADPAKTQAVYREATRLFDVYGDATDLNQTPVIQDAGAGGLVLNPGASSFFSDAA